MGPASPPPPPTPIESGGTHARSPSPEPPYLGKRIYIRPMPPTPILAWVLVIIGRTYTKHALSRAFSGQRTQIPLFPEKMGTRTWRALMHSSGGGVGLKLSPLIALLIEYNTLLPLSY